MYSRVLKIKDGKFVKVQNFEDGLKLCAVESQSDDHTVWIQKHIINNWIALKFNYKDEWYFLKAKEKSLELDSSSDSKLSKSSLAYWFEKHDTGTSEHYGLRAVLQPRRYVCITERGRSSLLSLSDTNQDWVQVKDE